jgi:hypothetical protein
MHPVILVHGSGTYGDELRGMARKMPNVTVGNLQIFHGARYS